MCPACGSNQIIQVFHFKKKWIWPESLGEGVNHHLIPMHAAMILSRLAVNSSEDECVTPTSGKRFDKSHLKLFPDPECMKFMNVAGY